MNFCFCWGQYSLKFNSHFYYLALALKLYPCLPEEKGLATTLALPGEHVWSKRKSPPKNPRVADLVPDNGESETFGMLLPKYIELVTLDLNLQLAPRESITAKGTMFLQALYNGYGPKFNDLAVAWKRPGMDLTSVASTCAPDMYMPAYAWEDWKRRASTDLEASHQTKYLLAEPQYGANNQIIAIMEAMAWARVLKRQLVLPPIFMPRTSDFTKALDEWPMTEKVLDFLEMNKPSPYGRPISFQEWSKLNIPVNRILRTSRFAKFDKATKILIDSLPSSKRETEIPILNVRHLFDVENGAPLKEAFVTSNLGSCSDRVLVFESMYFNKLNTGVGRMKRLANSVQFTSGTKNVLHILRSKLQKQFGQQRYACYHMRLGDFTSMCGRLESNTKGLPKDFFAWFIKLIEEQGMKCSVTAEEVLETITFLGLPALVLSNDVGAIKDKLQTEAIKMISSEWVQSAIAEVLPESMNDSEMDLLNLVVEQELCADADVSILNAFSTVSKRISQRAESKKHVTYFWNKKTKNWLIGQKHRLAEGIHKH